MKKLYLLRHAKSDWQANYASDFDRPLNKRGFHAAKMMGRYFDEHQIDPDLIFCSAAKRTLSTLDTLKQAVALSGQIEIMQNLYLCGLTSILDEIASIDENVESLLIIAHSPDLHNLAQSLTHDDKLSEKYPTAGFCEIDITTSWDKISDEQHKLVHFIKPKSLPYY